jgi:hypothetical protein
MDYSGFISNFSSNFSENSSYLDILSSSSSSVALTGTPVGPSSAPYSYGHGRYFYIGNLLIQFTDYPSSGFFYVLPNDTAITIDFPIAFSGVPYSVVPYSIIPPTQANPAPGNAPITLNSAINSNFSISIASNPSCVGFIAIGPR